MAALAGGGGADGIRLLAGFVAAAALAACAPLGFGSHSAANPHTAMGATPSAPSSAATPSPAGLALDDEIGAVIMAAFKGALTEEIARDWARHRYGGLLIVNLNRNGTDPDAIRATITRLREASGGRLLAATDEEGNGICTDVSGIPCLSNAPANIGQMSAAIKSVGFDVNLAPVADVVGVPGSIMSGRSYGTDPAFDAQQVAAAVDAIRGAGLLAAAKHFPGHGATTVSSEDRLPVITETLQSLRDRDWTPFRAAIEHRVDFVMVGHLNVTALDPGVPSTVSKPVMDALRAELGYRGAVISDDIEMGAVTNSMPAPEAAVRFLVNGGDMVMVAHDLSVADQVFEAIKAAVLSGRLPRARLDEAVSRLSALRSPAR